MIPMSCPSCGRRGNVPPDRLNSRLHCKKCDAVFYMDAMGQVVLGDPADQGKKKGRGAKPAKKKSSEVSMDVGAELSELVEKVPKPVRIGGAVAAVLALIYFFVPMPNLGGAPLPPAEDLLGRAGYLAELAFIDEKPSNLKKITAPGTEAEAQQWYQDLRPTFDYKGPKKQGNIVLISGDIVQKDDGAGVAVVMIQLIPPNAVPKTDATDPPGQWAGYRTKTGYFSFPTHWTRAEDGQWLLDGAKTLEATKPAPTASASTTTRRL